MFTKFWSEKFRDICNVFENNNYGINSIVLRSMVMIGICQMLE